MAFGAVSSDKITQNNIKSTNDRSDYTHTVFLEIGTAQCCYPCHYWGENVFNAYTSGDYDFQYVEMIIYDDNFQELNDEAITWGEYYDVTNYPTSIFDGNYKNIIGNFPDELPDKLNDCGNRDVLDITADMTVLWIGDATIQVDIVIENHESTQYNGHIRASITEIISRYDTYEGEPYHFGFLDFAFNQDITVSPGGTYTDSVIWNGNEHSDNHGDNFGDIVEDNIQVTMGVINNQNGWVDETVSARIGENLPPDKPNNPNPFDGETNVDINYDLSWECNDPDGGIITYDVYFGIENPPSLVASDITEKTFDPGEMLYKTTYYWKIVAEDDQGATTSGPIWSFSIKDKGKDEEYPSVNIIKPKKGLYINNKKILPRLFRLSYIIGNIEISVNADDKSSGIEKVEFYINGKLMGEDTEEPYTFLWEKDRIRLFNIFLISVIAYDNVGKTSLDRMIVKRTL